MAEPEKDEHGCIVGKEHWDADANACVLNTDEKAKELGMGLEKRIEGVIHDVLDMKLKALEKAMDEKIDRLLKEKEVEMELALRKGFGLDEDRPLMMSDLHDALPGILRKAALEAAEPQKKSPAASEKAGPDGMSEPSNPWQKDLAKYGVTLP